ncbi:MAG TPA: NACHT domain-containing protein [Pyrinomonadaceae bacterium]|nr:NACHT domain-containing protein [Pyrinomonadaceae bacterium]
MPDLKEIIDGLVYALKQLFGENLHPLIIKIVIGAVLLALLVRGAIWFIKMLTENIGPLLYSADEKKRARQRRRFAEHIEREIKRLNSLEEWNEYRFAELEAEVEADAERRVFRLFGFGKATRSGLRRERSLSKALEKSKDRLIQLEGDPGSGKSVALRFVAQSLADRASRSGSTKSLIPIYINLKELSRLDGEPVDRTLIESFVFKSLNRVNDRDIEEYLEQEFSTGIKDGTWLFLFDSFDEIPEILSSTEADAVIRSHADAISDFLSGMNQCRGVLASRHFRGPGGSQWAQFRILPLSEKRRLNLIRKAELEPVAEGEVISQLGFANPEIRDMIRNPMLLGLLCAHMKSGNSFPSNTHTLFATYIDNRLTRDRDRLWRRFKIEPGELRVVSEQVAFVMAADLGLGLSPSRKALTRALINRGTEIAALGNFEVTLDALEFIKLARSEVASAVGDSKPFTFAHRRFQEYFATCVALREPERVTAKDLVSDARWRETAVVMCQTQPVQSLSPLLDELRRTLALAINSVPEEFLLASDVGGAGEKQKRTVIERFPWPLRALHVLSLVQDGFGRRLTELPSDIRVQAATLVNAASSSGGHFDRKWALEVAGALPASELTELIRRAFATGSQMLNDVAYRQVARLTEIPGDIVRSIYKGLTRLALEGRLQAEKYSTYAHLARLDKAGDFMRAFRLLLWIPFVDGVTHAVIFVVAAATLPKTEMIVKMGMLLVLLLACAFSHLSLCRPQYLGAGSISLAKGNIMLRIYALIFVPGVVILLARGLHGPALTLLPLLFYILAWAPSALLASRVGQFTSIGWWPVMPLVTILILGKNLGSILSRVFENKRKALGVIFLTITLVVISGVLVFAIIRFVDITSPIVMWVMYAIYSFSLLVFLVGRRHWVKDRIHWIRGSKNYAHSITSSEFLRLVEQYSTATMRLRLIGRIRKNASLVATEETENMIAKLCLRIERDRMQRQSSRSGGSEENIPDFFTGNKSEPVSVDRDEFDTWYETRLIKKGTLFPHEFDILDELSLLLEQIRARQHRTA